MAGDIKKEKKKVELENLGRLVDLYAQSRALGLLIPLAIIVINTVLLIGSIELALWKPEARWTGIIFWLVALWVPVSIWVCYKLVARYGDRFYAKDGKVELRQEKTSVLAFIVFVLAFLGATVLGAVGVIPIRWTLTLAFTSAGLFVLYCGKRDKQTPLCIVWGTLLLVEAAAIAVGIPTPFEGRDYLYSLFAALMIYLVGAGLVAMLVAHIYNRMTLRKIKRMRLFDEQQTDKSDS